MKPIKINHEQAVCWKGYESKKVGKIEDLWALSCANGAIYSAWKPSFLEKLKILFGVPIWIGIFSQRQMPMCVAIERKIWKD